MNTLSKLLLTVVTIGVASVLFGQSQLAEKSSLPAAGSAVATSANAVTPDYIIGSDDLLAITVWKEPDMSKTVPVRPDGKITLPLIGDIQAEGLTPRKLQDNITEGLKSFVSTPEVTVIVQEVRSSKFNIVGEITRPGPYPLSGPTTVLDAIAAGGGLRDFAKRSHIYVLRIQPDGSHSRLPFNYKQVIKGKDLEQNVELRPGDTIVVP